MRTLPAIDPLPPGYLLQESPRGILAVAEDLAEGFRAAGFGPENDGDCRPSDLAGRRPLRELVVGTARFVVRSYHHGGLLRGVTNDRFGDPARPFRELLLADALGRAGIRTPRVAAARARMAPFVGWQLDLVTERIDGCMDLGQALEALRADELGPRQRCALFRAVGELVRELHELGFRHADLQPRNLLVRRDSLDAARLELTVLDLDGSEFSVPLGRAERQRNLRRLYRAVRRRERRGRAFLTRSDFARFFAGYRGERFDDWKRDWRAVEAAHRRGGPWHALGWRLERAFGSGPERRDGQAVVRR